MSRNVGLGFGPTILVSSCRVAKVLRRAVCRPQRLLLDSFALHQPVMLLVFTRSARRHAPFQWAGGNSYLVSQNLDSKQLRGQLACKN